MNEDPKKIFWSTLRTEWYPSLRVLGFKGSGQHFVRVRDSMLDCITLQTRRDGGSYCVNLGMHPRRLPSVSGHVMAETKMQVVDCELRRRLAPVGQADHWWYFGKTPTEAAAAATDLAVMFQTQGETYFQKYQSIQDLVGNARPEHIAKEAVPLFNDFPSTAVRAALLLARLHSLLGNAAAAHAFAKYGLDQTSPVKGAGLRKHFRELLASNQPGRSTA